MSGAQSPRSGAHNEDVDASGKKQTAADEECAEGPRPAVGLSAVSPRDEAGPQQDRETYDADQLKPPHPPILADLPSATEAGRARAVVPSLGLLRAAGPPGRPVHARECARGHWGQSPRDVPTPLQAFALVIGGSGTAGTAGTAGTHRGTCGRFRPEVSIPGGSHRPGPLAIDVEQAVKVVKAAGRIPRGWQPAGADRLRESVSPPSGPAARHRGTGITEPSAAYLPNASGSEGRLTRRMYV
jgi:hypothetical protein